MTNTTALLLLAAAFIAPHVPAFVGLIIGVIFLFIGVFS
jgi:hypothetical protein